MGEQFGIRLMDPYECPRPLLQRDRQDRAEQDQQARLSFSEEEEKALDTLRRALSEGEDPVDAVPDDKTLIRFLRARQLNVSKAKEMFQKTAAWRKEVNVEQWHGRARPSTETFAALVPCAWHGHDRHGRAIYIERTGQILVDKYFALIPDQLTIDCHIWFMEVVLRSFNEAVERSGRLVSGSVMILDLDGLGLAHRKLAHLFPLVTKIDQDYYPELLGSMYIINAPWIFAVIWKLVRPLVDEKTKTKINILGRDLTRMVEDVGAENLPEMYGGTCRCVESEKLCCLPVTPSGEAADRLIAEMAAKKQESEQE